MAKVKESNFVNYPAFVNAKINEDVLKKIFKITCNPYWYRQAAEFKNALAVAAGNKYYVLAAFTSYGHCNICDELKKDVFDQCQFGFWTIGKGLILANIDYGNGNKAESDLFTKYNIKGVPQVLKLNPDGSERGRCKGYNVDSNVGAWTAWFDSLP
jgi:thioredoxin-related protein